MPRCQNHPDLRAPHDDDKLWRYMDFTKFVSMLHDRALFFTRADQFRDKWEGVLSTPSLEQWRKEFGEPMDGIPMHREMRQHMFINCWHLSRYESAAMWGLYLKSDEGIAVQTTAQRLRESVKDVEGPNNFPIFVGRVHYLNYDREYTPVGNIFQTFLCKRQGFSHESEVRAMMMDLEALSDGSSPQPISKHGILVPVHPLTLIENVYISPTSPSWFARLVEDLLAKYDFKVSIKQSQLNQDPVF